MSNRKPPCNYRRNGCRCKRKRMISYKFCDYHQNGGLQLSDQLYYSVERQLWLKPAKKKKKKVVDDIVSGEENLSGSDDNGGVENEPQRNDMKILTFENKLAVYDGDKFRQICIICWHQKKTISGYCCSHNPDKPNKNFSKKACEFLDTLAAQENITILHAHHTKGVKSGYEHKIEPTEYMVDGYVPEERKIFEFLGDYWHGNPEKYDRDDVNDKSKLTFGQLYDNTFKRFGEIKKLGYQIFYIWERDYDKSTRTTLMRDLLHEYHDINVSSTTLQLKGVRQPCTTVDK
jgi:hypothetical protein